MHNKSLLKKNDENENVQNLIANQIIRQNEPKIYFDWAELTVYIFTNGFIIGLMIFITCAFFLDLIKKHKIEVDLQYFEISQCREAYKENKCDDPVPQVKDFCLDKEKCIMGDPNKMIKNINIFYRLIVEVINEFAERITNRALLVSSLIVFVAIHSYRSIKQK